MSSDDECGASDYRDDPAYIAREMAYDEVRRFFEWLEPYLSQADALQRAALRGSAVLEYVRELCTWRWQVRTRSDVRRLMLRVHPDRGCDDPSATDWAVVLNQMMKVFADDGQEGDSRMLLELLCALKNLAFPGELRTSEAVRIAYESWCSQNRRTAELYSILAAPRRKRTEPAEPAEPAETPAAPEPSEPTESAPSSEPAPSVDPVRPSSSDAPDEWTPQLPAVDSDGSTDTAESTEEESGEGEESDSPTPPPTPQPSPRVMSKTKTKGKTNRKGVAGAIQKPAPKSGRPRKPASAAKRSRGIKQHDESDDFKRFRQICLFRFQKIAKPKSYGQCWRYLCRIDQKHRAGQWRFPDDAPPLRDPVGVQQWIENKRVQFNWPERKTRAGCKADRELNKSFEVLAASFQKDFADWSEVQARISAGKKKWWFVEKGTEARVVPFDYPIRDPAVHQPPPPADYDDDTES